MLKFARKEGGKKGKRTVRKEDKRERNEGKGRKAREKEEEKAKGWTIGQEEKNV